MSSLIALCTKCNRPFEAHGFIDIQGGGIVNFSGNYYGPCPYCGGNGKVLDGTFRFDKGIATLVSGPGITREVLEGLKKVAENAKAKNYTPQQFKEEALKVSLAVSPLFNSDNFWKVANSPATANFIAFLALLITIITALLAKRTSGNQVIHHHHYYPANSLNEEQDEKIKRIKGVNTNFTPPKKKRKK